MCIYRDALNLTLSSSSWIHNGYVVYIDFYWFRWLFQVCALVQWARCFGSTASYGAAWSVAELTVRATLILSWSPTTKAINARAPAESAWLTGCCWRLALSPCLRVASSGTEGIFMFDSRLLRRTSRGIAATSPRRVSDYYGATSHLKGNISHDFGPMHL